MLETIREFAREQLEADEWHRRHADYFARLAEDAYSHRFEAEEEWSTRLELDHDDLRAALEWRDEHDPEGALELAGALGWFWLSHSHLAEGKRRLDDALARFAGTGRTRARALCRGQVRSQAGSATSSAARRRSAKESRSGASSATETEVAAALDLLGWSLFHFLTAGRDEESLEAFEESLAIWRQLGDSSGERRGLVGVCQMLVAMGEVERAEPLSLELLELSRGRDLRSEHFAHHYLADCALIRGDCALAEERYRESLRAALPLGDVVETTFEVQGVAMALAGQGDRERGVRLAAAAATVLAELGVQVSIAFWDALLERYIGSAREELGATGDAAWEEGRQLSFDAAVEQALQSV